MEHEQPTASHRDINYLHLMRLLDRARSVRRQAFNVVDTQRGTMLAKTLAGLPDDTSSGSAQLSDLLLVSCHNCSANEQT